MVTGHDAAAAAASGANLKHRISSLRGGRQERGILVLVLLSATVDQLNRFLPHAAPAQNTACSSGT